MARNPNFITVYFDGDKVTIVQDGDENGKEITGVMPFGKKGELELMSDENGKFFVYRNGAGKVAYTQPLNERGEYTLSTTKGERILSEWEQAAIYREMTREKDRVAAERQAELRDIRIGWGVFRNRGRTHHKANEPLVIEIDDLSVSRWTSDGNIERKPFGNGRTEITITGATYAWHTPHHLHEWPGFKPNDEFIRELGMTADVIQGMMRER